MTPTHGMDAAALNFSAAVAPDGATVPLVVARVGAA